jgi:hypothetical protein
MQETRIPIDGEKLAKRWGIQPIDLLFMMMNHELKTIDQLGDYVDIDILFEVYGEDRENFDFLSLMFSFADIQRLEDEYLGDHLAMKKVVIRGQSLMNKWDMDGAEIFSIAFQEGWDFFDPFGFPIKEYYEFILKLCNDQILKISDVLFQLSDVEEFEREKGLQLSERDEIVADSPFPEDKMDKKDGIPLISFYKNCQKWMIGERGKERIFDNLIGFEIIRFLLRYPEKRFEALQAHYCGNVPVEVQPLIYQKKLENNIDSSTVKKIKKLMKESQEKLKEARDFDEKNNLIENIEKCEDFLKIARQGLKTDKDKVRINVRKVIKRAIETINIEAQNYPSLRLVAKSLCLENPHKTIITGNSCCYRPEPSNPVKWILDPPK